MILLDTSVVIETFTGNRRAAPAVRRAIESGERLVLATLVLYEWLRGPRTARELADQEALLPRNAALPFGTVEAARAADLYAGLRSPRGREIDLAIAACALTWDATLWTANVDDFRDIPGLEATRPSTARP
ncbi:MAG: type II toxin-antitoxin system VapC family toxin [Gemmatimonadales bacterium]